jgi:hypothetical protein
LTILVALIDRLDVHIKLLGQVADIFLWLNPVVADTVHSALMADFGGFVVPISTL